MKDNDNPYSIIDNFISKYNVASDNQITNISILDIRDSDYRVEYRLNAFKNAVGEKGFIGNTEIQIVNYGVYANNSLRFYFTIDTADVGTNICYNIVRLLDDSVPYDDFVNAFSKIYIVINSNISIKKLDFLKYCQIWNEADSIIIYICTNSIFISVSIQCFLQIFFCYI